METTIGTVVIGGGQAGLVTGYYLARQGEPFVILEAGWRVGDSWRRRYDSLRLFSFPRYASLPGWRIPVDGCPTRDEMADYLERYAARSDLPVRTGVRVNGVSRQGGRFLVRTDHDSYLADQVVVATGAHQRASTPDCAALLDPAIRQLHSVEYRNPSQLAPGNVLVVGAGNSGTDIALEAARTHPTWLAGRHPGQVPVDIDSPRARAVIPIVMFVVKHVLTLRTPVGRAQRQKVLGHGATLVRNKIEDLDAAGITRVGRIVGVRDGLPVAEEVGQLDISTVVWCTGSDADYSWLNLPVIGSDGLPSHHRGVCEAEPGLYFMGLDFQFSLASATIQGIDRDARYVVRRLRRQARKAHRAGAQKSEAAVSRARTGTA
jgi:putative flavoprotein involved in K+ transport